ncbi:hypothetical protein [Rhodococcus sp. 14-2470-1a]|uniref:hypothetical protein n=1 Tax=Rhodococcus sp. 14-2470-1a TaxID=2023150 RepID=UPI000B9B023C|nr:hypothetical protein [Rhodococcus sp. 14-2470-1a]OZF41923.1 hypothetical protein CH292_27340 [Rhodococcus sp. 14-2470-1a]
MPEFRLKVPEDRRRHAEFIREQDRTVREHLSRCCSPVDGDELAGEVVVTRRPSRTGGFWIHGLLDRAVIDTAEPADPADWAHQRPATEGKSTDLDAADLREHMARKAER